VPCSLGLGYPHTLPHMGRGAHFKSSFAHKGFVAFRLCPPSPTSVGFAAHAAVGLRAAKRPCSPKTSLVADATNGFTHGRDYGVKGQVSFLQENEFNDGLNGFGAGA
jgi:hypothetical protein